MHWQTKLIDPNVRIDKPFRSLSIPVSRGSTILFDRLSDASDNWRQTEVGYTYGLYGSSTVLELGARIAEIEGAKHSFIVPGGQAAIAAVYIAYCGAGSHVLVPHSAYNPNRELGQSLLPKFGIEVEEYDPLIGSGISELLRPETSLVWIESPGSVTMEIQDVPAIVEACKARGVTVALDNTYAAGVLFDAFGFGVDVSLQALTKYVGGHSDLLLGSISMSSDAHYEKIGASLRLLGMAVSPDDASLALRGLQTLGIRLEHLERSTLTVASWLSERSEIAKVLHPAFPDCPGHEIWKRDFSGSSSVFSVIFKDDVSPDAVNRFADGLELFRPGYSWGGVTSLVMTYPRLRRPTSNPAGRIVRFNVGLERVEDLIADLKQSFDKTF